MHFHSIDRWTHEHLYLGAQHRRNERRTRLVIALTAVMMIAEVAAGMAFGSMALLADGLHMATHAGALFIAVAAYAYARRHAHDPRFTFGTGKVGDLAGFTSALILALVALLIGYESLQRVFAPVPIRFDEAIAVAALGLAVNLLSAWLLRGGEPAAEPAHAHDAHGHSHHHHADHNLRGGEPAAEPAHAHDAHGHSHHHHADHNLRGAYLHVLADAATSVLAIVALVAGRLYGWSWMDPLMGLVGALLIARWSYRLMADTAAILVDASPARSLETAVRARLENDGDRVADLHLWRVGPGHNAAALTIVTDRPRAPDHYKDRLRDLPGLSHLTIEVQPCS